MRLLRQTVFSSRRAFYCTSKQEKSPFERELVAKIKMTGPMSIAQFMQEVLMNPFKGYYTTKEKVLGSSGDFITSPEISQMFGECVAIWIIHEWRKMGSVKPLQLVELGPGHGTLMADILKTVKRLVPDEIPNLSVHMVEASDKMKLVQEARLCGYSGEKGVSKQGPKVDWHTRLSDVPKGFTFFVANEFFDALPVHKFVRDPETKNWQEVLVDIATEDESLKFVRSRQKTLANHYVDSAYDHMEAIEISPKSGIVIETISERIVEHGGAALIADYGNASCSENKVVDSFRAFQDHQLCDPLKNVGQADLTADVDFDYLKSKTSEHAKAFGPVPQSQFLTQLGIVVRCNLLKEANPEHADELQRSLDFLISPQKMGSRFKFFSIFPKTVEFIHPQYTPVGFYEPKSEK